MWNTCVTLIVCLLITSLAVLAPFYSLLDLQNTILQSIWNHPFEICLLAIYLEICGDVQHYIKKILSFKHTYTYNANSSSSTAEILSRKTSWLVGCTEANDYFLARWTLSPEGVFCPQDLMMDAFRGNFRGGHEINHPGPSFSDDGPATLFGWNSMLG